MSLTVLDDARAGDAWRLLDDLPPTRAGADDDDLARGRALVRALAEVDPAGDPVRSCACPPTGFPDRAGLTVHAVFGVVSDPAVRRGSHRHGRGRPRRPGPKSRRRRRRDRRGRRAGSDCVTHLTSGPDRPLVVARAT